MTLLPDAPSNPFTEAGQASDEMLAHVAGYLDAAAAHPLMRRIRQVALEALHPLPGQRLLDAGCGLGHAARELAEHVVPDGEVVALDVSAPLIELAARRQNDVPVSYQVGNVSALDFPDESFDAVRCERVLQHVADPDRAIAELIRVTRRGGTVCLIDTDWESLALDGIDKELPTAFRTRFESIGMEHHHDMGRTLRGRLVRAGLSDVETHPVTLHFTDPTDASAVLPMIGREDAPMVRLLPQDLVTAWFSAIREAAARGDFLAALTIWVASGTR